MLKLNLPEYEFKLKKNDEKVSIFDEVQKKFRILTPEEWVRQNLIKYLVTELNYPAGLISVEFGIKVNTMQRRYDVLVYNTVKEPVVLIECKAPTVKITQKTFDQVFAYNKSINSKNILVSNGLSHYFCRLNDVGKPEFLDNIPGFKELGTDR